MEIKHCCFVSFYFVVLFHFIFPYLIQLIRTHLSWSKFRKKSFILISYTLLCFWHLTEFRPWNQLNLRGTLIYNSLNFEMATESMTAWQKFVGQNWWWWRKVFSTKILSNQKSCKNQRTLTKFRLGDENYVRRIFVR